MNTLSFPEPAGSLAPRPSSRRQFLQSSALVAAGFAFAPAISARAAGEKAPGEKLNVAGIGIGGMGGNNIKQCSGENIVALCDVDQAYAAHTFKEYPKARAYLDYREMIDKQKDIDAIIIATPDHTTRRHCHGRHPRGQTCLRPETPGLFRPRSPHPDRSGPRAQSRHPDGQPGPFQRRHTPGLRMDPRPASSEPSGKSTPGPTAPSGPRASRSAAPRKPRPSPPAWTGSAGLGRLLTAPIIRLTCPGNWRAWCDFGTGSPRRPGLPHPRRGLLGHEPQIPLQRRRLHLHLLA